MGAPAQTGSAGYLPSQEELPAVLRAGLRRDHISASTKTANGGAGPEMPLKGRGRPGSCSQGESRGHGGADRGCPRSSHSGHHGNSHSGLFITPAEQTALPTPSIPGSLGARKVGLLVTGLPIREQPPSPTTDHTPGRHCHVSLTTCSLRDAVGLHSREIQILYFPPELLQPCWPLCFVPMCLVLSCLGAFALAVLLAIPSWSCLLC